MVSAGTSVGALLGRPGVQKRGAVLADEHELGLVMRDDPAKHAGETWKQVSDCVVARQRLQQVVHHGQLLAGERGWIDTERHLPSACPAPEARAAGAHNSSASNRPLPPRPPTVRPNASLAC